MRYYFDTTVGADVQRDNVGVDCETRDEARRLAEKAIGELICDALPDGGDEMFVIEVRPQGSAAMFRAQINLRTQWLD